MNRRQTAMPLGAGLLCAFAAGALAVRRKLRAGKPTPAAPQQDDPLADLLSSHNQPDQGSNANPWTRPVRPRPPKGCWTL